MQQQNSFSNGQATNCSNNTTSPVIEDPTAHEYKTVSAFIEHVADLFVLVYSCMQQT